MTAASEVSASCVGTHASQRSGVHFAVVVWGSSVAWLRNG